MKNALFKVCCILLALACIFSLFACVAGVKDILNIKDYKLDDSQTAKDGIAAARDGIAQLSENEEAYSNGVGQYQAGLAQYAQGKKALADGQKQYNEGKKTLEDGKAQLAANKEAYEAGKEKLAKIEPLMPYIEAFIELRNMNDYTVDSIAAAVDGLTANAGLPKMGPSIEQTRAAIRLWFVNAVRPIAANIGLDIPEGAEDILLFVQNMVADGKAQIKQYEDGMAAVAAGEPALAAAEKQLADGKKQLNDASGQLAAADEQLGQFEGGSAQLAAGLMQLIDGMQSVYTPKGEFCVEGLAERLGEDFSIWMLDDKGEIVVKRGCQFLDLNSCSLLLDKAEEYLDDAGVDTEGELYPRIGIYAAVAIASIFGLIAACIGLFGKKKFGFTAGIICAVLAVAANVAGIITGYTDYAYKTMEMVDGAKVFTYSGNLQFAAIVCLAAMAVIFVIVASVARKGAAAVEAAAVVEAAPAIDPAKLAELEAENEALKEMVANLAADAATVEATVEE